MPSGKFNHAAKADGPIVSAHPVQSSLDKALTGKTAWQALRANESGQAFNPLRAPVRSAMHCLRMPGRAARSIALIFARSLVGIGIAATAALYAIEFIAGAEVVALVTASQMSVYFEMDNHEETPW